MHQLYRLLPKVDECLQDENIKRLIDGFSRQEVVSALRHELDNMRQNISEGLASEADLTQFPARLPVLVESRILSCRRPSLRRVVNATGVVLHTNLGRAPLPEVAVQAVAEVARGYSNLEYDLTAGVRGSRHDHVRDLIRDLTGAEDAIVVNNNAAAVLLMLSALAGGREVVVSRGQLVEVGGSFRIPDVMAQGGAILKEVGSTNKTHVADYLKAVTDQTVALLKVHTSNFRMVGFVSEVSTEEMVQLAHSKGLLALEDLGSGMLVGGMGEPTVQEVVSAGMDVVTFSGDKLLGGPQAGLIAGRRDLIDTMRRHPLARAVRIDKMTLAALSATLELYRRGEAAVATIPVMENLRAGEEVLRDRATNLCEAVLSLGLCGATVIPVTAPAGGGSLPAVDFSGYGVALDSAVQCNLLEARLRSASVPVIARIIDDKVVLDPRTLSCHDQETLLEMLREVLLP